MIAEKALRALVTRSPDRPLEGRWWKHKADGLRCLQVHREFGGRDGDDWSARRQPCYFGHDRWTPCHDEPTPEPNQVRGKFGNPVGGPGRMTRLDEDISIGS